MLEKKPTNGIWKSWNSRLHEVEDLIANEFYNSSDEYHALEKERDELHAMIGSWSNDPFTDTPVFTGTLAETPDMVDKQPTNGIWKDWQSRLAEVEALIEGEHYNSSGEYHALLRERDELREILGDWAHVA